MVEHSLGKGEVTSSILVIGSRVEVSELRRSMTGSWLILKGVGTGIVVSYLVLLLVVFWQLRRELSRLRFRWVAPIVVGNFVALTLPWIFDSVPAQRACLIVADAIFLGGIAVLVRDLARHDVTAVRAIVDASR